MPNSFCCELLISNKSVNCIVFECVCIYFIGYGKGENRSTTAQTHRQRETHTICAHLVWILFDAIKIGVIHLQNTKSFKCFSCLFLFSLFFLHLFSAILKRRITSRIASLNLKNNKNHRHHRDLRTHEMNILAVQCIGVCWIYCDTVARREEKK